MSFGLILCARGYPQFTTTLTADKVISSMDDFGDECEALGWSQSPMRRTTGCYSTHYYKPDNQAQLLSPMLSLSVTEECDGCVILGVVSNGVIPTTAEDVYTGCSHIYFSPIARRSTDGSYKIIVVVLLETFQNNEPRIGPQQVRVKCSEALIWPHLSRPSRKKVDQWLFIQSHWYDTSETSPALGTTHQR
ncbi:hypothetical protein BJV82DRAFT_672205 [Fennellomyces sp. T-0311]|nr:hypothetical protein BJV82DRAFT_672205 [Fennellomyces sp. T-0311]